MNLTGIWNHLPDLSRSSQPDGVSSSGSGSAPNSGSRGAIPNGGKTDQADLSPSGLIAAQSAGSDVRMEKVDSVRAALNSGAYQVSAQSVAEKMIASLLS